LDGPPGAFWPLTVGAIPPIPGVPLSTSAIARAAPALLLSDCADAAPAMNAPAQTTATTNLVMFVRSLIRRTASVLRLVYATRRWPDHPKPISGRR
jgi:hypothetical protein